MELQLYNTLTRKVEPVVPGAERPLRLYSCGPTVYAYAHIGNFRSFLTSDLIIRTAHAVGLQTRYVSNITDVGHLSEDDVADSGGQDRMEKALESEEGQRFPNVWSLADHYTAELLKDWAALNLLEPDVRPRATQHMREQILAIEALIERGHAYETENAVYFSVPSFPEYGKLSGNIDAEALAEGVRDVVVDEEKRDPRDFALWKKDDKHLMQWFSPWGWGFPGWHLECSVMATEYLGEAFDIHAGGEDLIFPHHECEMAQAESLSDQPFAKHWVHTRFLKVEGKKMSKSEGNYLLPRDLMEDVDPLALRYALISGHYRKPFNFTFKHLEDSSAIVARLKDVASRAGAVLQSTNGSPSPGELDADLESSYEAACEALCDNLNTPKALSATIAGLKFIEKQDRFEPAFAASVLKWLDRINDLLGIVAHGNVSDLSAEPTDEEDTVHEEEIESLIEERSQARAAKNWDRADEIRDTLREMGVELKDSPDGTTWKRA